MWDSQVWLAKALISFHVRVKAALRCSFRKAQPSERPTRSPLFAWCAIFEAVGADFFRNLWLPLTMGRNKMVLAGHPRPCETRTISMILKEREGPKLKNPKSLVFFFKLMMLRPPQTEKVRTIWYVDADGQKKGLTFILLKVCDTVSHLSETVFIFIFTALYAFQAVGRPLFKLTSYSSCPSLS